MCTRLPVRTLRLTTLYCTSVGHKNIYRLRLRRTRLDQGRQISWRLENKMSTTYMTIHDLLRITYTYEAQALEAEAQARSRSSSQSSICSVSPHTSPSFLSTNRRSQS